MNRYFPLFVLLALSIGCDRATADEVINQLKSESIDRFEFGLFRLRAEIDNWTQSYTKHPGVNVNIVLNDSNGISFAIIGSHTLFASKTKTEVTAICNEIREHFFSMILGNFGDPTMKNVDGGDMYKLEWGRYFAPVGAASEEIENIGKGVSTDSELMIYTGHPGLRTCVFRSGDKY